MPSGKPTEEFVDATKLHVMGAHQNMDETQNVLNEIKLSFKPEGRYGIVKDTDFEWLVNKLERAIQFNYKILT